MIDSLIFAFVGFGNMYQMYRWERGEYSYRCFLGFFQLRGWVSVEAVVAASVEVRSNSNLIWIQICVVSIPLTDAHIVCSYIYLFHNTYRLDDTYLLKNYRPVPSSLQIWISNGLSFIMHETELCNLICTSHVLMNCYYVCPFILENKMYSTIFTRGQFCLRVLSLPAWLCTRVCVCLSVCQSLACSCDNSGPVQARITKFGPKMQKTLFKVPIVLWTDRPWPSRSNLTYKSKFIPFWDCLLHN